MTGFVKFVSPKGWGFISVPSRIGDVFFHQSEIIGNVDVEANDYVQFDIKETDRGSKAVNITKL